MCVVCVFVFVLAFVVAFVFVYWEPQIRPWSLTSRCGSWDPGIGVEVEGSAGGKNFISVNEVLFYNMWAVEGGCGCWGRRAGGWTIG